MVDSVGGQLEGMVTSMAVDSSNRPHISYVGGNLEDNKYATQNPDGTWFTVILDGGDFTSAGNAIALDSSDHVYFSYHHMASHELRYQTNADGSMGAGFSEPVDWGGWTNAIAVDASGVAHISYEASGKVKYATKDGDKDGVADTEEQGPDGTNINFDGNQDNTPDSQQSHVTSFHTITGTYVTLASPEGTVLVNVKSKGNPSPADAPPGVEFPFGFLEFTIHGVQAGGSTTVSLFLPEGMTVETFYKYGPTPDNSTPHWYEFLYDGQTGAVINDNVIFLHFVDGLRGDHDLMANGVIVEPGAPGLLVPIPGDCNGDGDVNLADAILALQILAGIEPISTCNTEADVNADAKIGLEEVIYILQTVSDIRP
jgi:hypothetical protein